MSAVIAIESGHFYLPDGTPFYTCKSKDGSERPTTLRDARKVGAARSVSAILKLAAKPQLEEWKQRQVMLAALTLPRLTSEDDEAFCDRILRDSKEQGRKAAERGSALHGAIELSILGKPYSEEWRPHVLAVWATLSSMGIDLGDGEAERSFFHPSGYGGKVDWHSRSQNIVIDFKSKDSIVVDKQYAYDEQHIQLAAYNYGLLLPADARLVNVFIGVGDKRVLVHEWEPEDRKRMVGMFVDLLSYCKKKDEYDPTLPDFLQGRISES